MLTLFPAISADNGDAESVSEEAHYAPRIDAGRIWGKYTGIIHYEKVNLSCSPLTGSWPPWLHM